MLSEEDTMLMTGLTTITGMIAIEIMMSMIMAVKAAE
jgi:hypothetical protein